MISPNVSHLYRLANDRVEYGCESWGHLIKDLSKQAATIMAVLIFIIIGPVFAALRTGIVAYEVAVTLFFIDASQAHLTLFYTVILMFVIGL